MTRSGVVGDLEVPENSKIISAVEFSRNANRLSCEQFRANLVSYINNVTNSYNFNRITESCGCFTLWPEIRIPYLDRQIVINLQSYEYHYDDKFDEKPPAAVIVPVLFYLENNKSSYVSGKWVNYAQLESGLFYSKTIRPHVIDSLIERFKVNPDELVDILFSLGGIKEPFKDFAFSLRPLPKFPVLIIGRYPDDEFNFDLNVLFDETASEHLSIDNIKTLTVALRVDIIARHIRLKNNHENS